MAAVTLYAVSRAAPLSAMRRRRRSASSRRSTRGRCSPRGRQRAHVGADHGPKRRRHSGPNGRRRRSARTLDTRSGSFRAEADCRFEDTDRHTGKPPGPSGKRRCAETEAAGAGSDGEGRSGDEEGDGKTQDAIRARKSSGVRGARLRRRPTPTTRSRCWTASRSGASSSAFARRVSSRALARRGHAATGLARRTRAPRPAGRRRAP